MNQKDDIYCSRIIPGKIPVKIEIETDKILAFRHTKPLYKFHIVIVPKEHIFDMTGLVGRDELTIEIVNVAGKLIDKYELQEKGAIFKTGLGKNRTTPHLHFHLLSGKKMR